MPQASAETLQQPMPLAQQHRKLLRRAGVLAIVLICLASFSPRWWVGKDSGLYLNLARSLARGQGYTLASQQHTHVPPGLPLILAGMMKLGLEAFPALNLLMLAAAAATAGLSYLLLRELVERDWALLLTVLVATSAEMVQRSGEILTEGPFMLLVTGALLLYLRGSRAGRVRAGGWEIASLLLVASCWVRIAGLPLALGAAVGLALSSTPRTRLRAMLNAGLVAAGLAITMTAFYLYYRWNHDPTASSEAGRLSDLAQGRLNPFVSFYWACGQLSRLYVAQRLPNLLALIALAVPVAAAMVRRAAKRDLIGPLAVACYVGGMCLMAAKLRTRYLLPVAPLLTLYLLEGYAWALSLSGRVSRKACLTVVLSLAGVMLPMNLAQVGRLIWQKHSRDYAAQQHGKWSFLHPTAEFLRSRGDGGAILGPQPLGYLCDRPCPMLSRNLLAGSPDSGQLEDLLARLKVSYVVFDPDDEPEPFHQSLRDHLRRLAPPVFTHGNVEVFQVPHVNKPPAPPGDGKKEAVGPAAVGPAGS